MATERKRTGMGEYNGDRAYVMFTMPTATKDALRRYVDGNCITFQDYLASLVNRDFREQGHDPLSFKSVRKGKRRAGQ